MKIRYKLRIPYTNPKVGDKIRLIKHDSDRKTVKMTLGEIYEVVSLRSFLAEQLPHRVPECVLGMGSSDISIFYLDPALFEKV